MKQSQSTQPQSVCDILIAGGGMVGLSLSIMLAKEMPHLSIIVVDPAPELDSKQPHTPPADHSFDARSTALSAGSVALFKAMAVWPHLVSGATPIMQVDVSDKGHIGRNNFPLWAAQKMPKTQGANYSQPLGYVVENKSIGVGLKKIVTTLSNIHTLSESHVTRFIPKASGAQVAVTSANTPACERLISTQLCVIADGAQSELRKKVGIDATVKSYQQHAVIANVEHALAHNGVAYERFTDEGPMALLPRGESVKARLSALVWTRPESDLERAINLTDTQFLQDIQTRFGYRLGQLQRVGRRDHYALKLILAQEQVRSSLVVLGNAAHFLHPVAGQGFNLAARDCAQLVSVLAGAAKGKLGELSRLNQYVNRQQADQLSTVTISHQFNRLFTSRAKPLQVARTLGLLAMQQAPGLQSSFYNRMMGRANSRPPLNFVRRYLASTANSTSLVEEPIP